MSWNDVSMTQSKFPVNLYVFRPYEHWYDVISVKNYVIDKCCDIYCEAFNKNYDYGSETTLNDVSMSHSKFSVILLVFWTQLRHYNVIFTYYDILWVEDQK